MWFQDANSAVEGRLPRDEGFCLCHSDSLTLRAPSLRTAASPWNAHPWFTKVARANHHAGFYPVKC